MAGSSKALCTLICPTGRNESKCYAIMRKRKETSVLKSLASWAETPKVEPQFDRSILKEEFKPKNC